MAQLSSTEITGSANLAAATADTSTAGNLWFDTEDNALKYSYAVQASVWSDGGAMIGTRERAGGAGTQNAAVTFGGTPGIPAYPIIDTTEEYDGSTWTSGGSMITARRTLAGAGTQNAALGFGGANPGGVSCTEEYNGSTWGAGGALIQARGYLAGAGTQNSGLAIAGSPTNTSSEEYNGSSWSSGGTLITGFSQSGGAGTQNAAVGFGGAYPAPYSANTEEYNGSTWSSAAAMITARSQITGAGTQNAALGMGGYTGNAPGSGPTGLSCTEEYDGSTWSAGGAMINTRRLGMSAGTQDAGLAMGGFGPPGTGIACTEEYGPVTSICTCTV